MKMSKDTYFTKMKPYADRASQATGIPSAVILAQWGLETGFGTSTASQKLNNHAGIKANSQGRDYDGGTYAGYNSLNKFVTDYVRVMNLSYYDKVRSVGKTGNVANTVKALDDSPWAEDKDYYAKIMNIINGTTPSQNGPLTARPNDILGNFLGTVKGRVEGLDTDQLQFYAVIGLGAILIKELLD